MPRLPSRQLINSVGFMACTLVVAYAYYLEVFEGLIPCPLCIIERLLMVVLGLVFLTAAIHNPRRRVARYYGVLIFVVAGISAAMAGYHVWLQTAAGPQQIGFCLPSLHYLITFFPITEVIDQVLASPHSCGGIDWSFLGLSIAAWALLVFVGLGVMGTVRNWMSE